MEKILSFTIDHERLERGLYKSRVDKNTITCDLRLRTPYKDALLSNAEMHSLEHLLATVLRNTELSESVIYVGPMGCQTGFYAVFESALTEKQIVELIIDSFKRIAFDDMEMPGDSKKECGNHLNLSSSLAKAIAYEYYNVIKYKIEFDSYT